jgi:hypothetical protein
MHKLICWNCEAYYNIVIRLPQNLTCVLMCQVYIMASRSSQTFNFIMYVFIFNLILGGQFGFRSGLKD